MNCVVVVKQRSCIRILRSHHIQQKLRKYLFADFFQFLTGCNAEMSCCSWFEEQLGQFPTTFYKPRSEFGCFYLYFIACRGQRHGSTGSFASNSSCWCIVVAAGLGVPHQSIRKDNCSTLEGRVSIVASKSFGDTLEYVFGLSWIEIQQQGLRNQQHAPLIGRTIL